MAQTKAYVDTNNKILHFPSRNILLETEKTVYEEQEQEILLAEANLADESDIEGDDEWESLDKEIIMTVNENLSVSDKLDIENFLIQHSGVFADSYDSLGCSKIGDHKINLTSESPIYFPPYRKSWKENELIDKEVEKMIPANIIRPSISSWSAPIVIVPKKDGSKRF